MQIFLGPIKVILIPMKSLFKKNISHYTPKKQIVKGSTKVTLGPQKINSYPGNPQKVLMLFILGPIKDISVVYHVCCLPLGLQHL